MPKKPTFSTVQPFGCVFMKKTELNKKDVGPASTFLHLLQISFQHVRILSKFWAMRAGRYTMSKQSTMLQD